MQNSIVPQSGRDLAQESITQKVSALPEREREKLLVAVLLLQSAK